MRSIVPFLLFLTLAVNVAAQDANDIATLVARVRQGEDAAVRALLPALEKKRPDDPGVLYLKALLEADAEKAVPVYQRIADEHPKSEWADDALFRLYQYSYAVGAYRTARTQLDRINGSYPKSPYARPEAAKEGGTSSAMAGSDAGEAGESWSVQVGAFSERADAEAQVADLKSKGYTASIQAKKSKDKTVHAVLVGIFPSFDKARNFANKLKQQQNIDALVVRRNP
ncbi:MAG TPA: SPOR domain-containing protein [Bacteroidota bacterium]|nr:SPOR domain-containing protein [Bacteroidota bacterium]